jgi:hypothetical protein
MYCIWTFQEFIIDLSKFLLLSTLPDMGTLAMYKHPLTGYIHIAKIHIYWIHRHILDIWKNSYWMNTHILHKGSQIQDMDTDILDLLKYIQDTHRNACRIHTDPE